MQCIPLFFATFLLGIPSPLFFQLFDLVNTEASIQVLIDTSHTSTL